MNKEQFEREADECGMMEYLDLHCDSVGIQMILDMVNGAVAAERKAIAYRNIGVRKMNEQRAVVQHMAEIKRLKDELEVWQRQVLEQGEVIAELRRLQAEVERYTTAPTHPPVPMTVAQKGAIHAATASMRFYVAVEFAIRKTEAHHGITAAPTHPPVPPREHDHALEQALTRLQKRYAELEAKVAARPAVVQQADK